MKFEINPIFPPFYEKANQTPPYITYTEHDLWPRDILSLHCHKHAEIGICLEGSGYNYIENRIYRFQAGDLQFISAYTPHLANSDKGIISKWIWISIDIAGIFSAFLKDNVELLSNMQETCFNGTFHPDEHPKFTQLIYELYDSLKKPDNLAMWRELFLVGELLLEATTIGDIDAQHTPTYKKSMDLYPVILYIQKNYWDKAAMKEENLAKISRYSVSHFRSRFKKEVGLSVQEFILKTRLSYAAHSLKTTKDPILKIAMDSGFGNISYFNRAFLNLYQCSPSQYRKNFFDSPN